MLKKLFAPLFAFFAMIFMGCSSAFAGEADLVVPNISSSPESFNYLVIGLVISVIGVILVLLSSLRLRNFRFTLLWLKSETLFLRLVRLI